MSYRDQLEAALARASTLEKELARRDAADEAEVARLKRERDKARAEVVRLRERLAGELDAPSEAGPGSSDERPAILGPAHRPKKPKRTPWILRILYGALVFGVTWGLVLLTPLSGWFWFVAVLALLGGWVLNWWLHPPSYISLPIFALFAVGPFTCDQQLTPHAFYGRAVTRISLATAQQIQDTTVVQLPQTRVDPSRKIHGSWVGGSSDNTYQIYAELAPIVASQGGSSGPVTAWAVCQAKSLETVKACTTRWKLPLQGGVSLVATSGLKWSIEKKGGPLPPNGAPLFLRWEDPLTTVRELRRNALLWLFGMFVVWSIWYSYAASQED